MPRQSIRSGAPLLLRPALLGLCVATVGINECPPVPPESSNIYGDLALDEADLLLRGSQEDGQAGLSVALMGDINNDGYDDVLVGAPGEGAGGTQVGAAYLIYGPTEGEMDLTDANAVFQGYIDRGYVGQSVSSPGDVNGDGFDDVLIGSGTANEAYLFYGPVTGTVSCADADARFIGAGSGDRAGAAVAGVGDVNDDGFPDVAVGAAMADDDGISDRGAVYIFWGGPDLVGNLSVLDAPLIIVGSQSREQAGASVAGVGDVNGDGSQDLMIGAPKYSVTNESREGAAYLLFGPFAAGYIQLGDAAIRYIGEESQDDAGAQLSAAGDVNRDGLDDFLIGARKADNLTGVDSGAAYLIYGGTLGLGDIRLERSDVKFIGEAAYDGAGFVSRGGDVNGDGFADLVIGASTHDVGGNDSGAAYVIYGPPAAGEVLLSDAPARISGVSAFDQAGYGVGGGGDVDRDGFHDVIVGAIYGDGPAIDVGTAGVFFGGN